MIPQKPEFWWQLFNCLPTSKNTIEYKRIKRIWADQTRFRGAKGTSKRKHNLFNLTSEQNLQVTLWENFSIFNKKDLAKEIAILSGFDINSQEVENISWSYEWEKPIYNNGYRVGIKLLDIVIKITTSHAEYLVVVECKNLTSTLGKKDIDSSYYLDDIEEFERFKEKKTILYCIGERVKIKVENQLKEYYNKPNIITWNDLAELQVDLCDKLDVEEKIKKFLSYSILKQFESKGIDLLNGNLFANTQMHLVVDTDIREIMNMNYNSVFQLGIDEKLKSYICGALLNQFPKINRTTLPLEYLYSELKQDQMDKAENQSRKEREIAIWDL